MEYDFGKFEKHWQGWWKKNRTYEPDLDRAKKPFYNLMMFPYPSAEGLHVGNMYAFTGSDIYGRMKRMQGHDVFEPIGLDGFGIHSENYALKIGKHPMEQAKISEKRFYEQLETIGNGFAWEEQLETYDPEYYKWTQWIFVQMFKHGLAYRKKQFVNWCPSCRTVLADEQIISGECERCETKVIKKELEQWFFRITKYADRLLENLEKLDWSERVKIAQKNWIGRSEGAEIDFEVCTKEKPNFVLLHGYKGSPERNFFPWLKVELEKRGYKVQAPLLPNADDPRVAEQAAHVLETVSFDRNTVLLGHSLGSVVAMKVVEQLPHSLRKTVLVGGFVENQFLDNDSFEPHTFDWRFDAERIRRNAGELRALRDLTDNAVPADQPVKLTEQFGGALIDFTAVKPHACGAKEPDVLRNVLDTLTVFTTRPDTLFGATYMVVAPEHSIIENLKLKIENWAEVERYVEKAKAKDEADRIVESGEKTGVELKGVKAVNPANGEEIPVWTADYVLGSYGTGAIMAVPAHDPRDWEFAKKHKLPITMVICPHYPAKTCPVLDEAYEGEGHLVASGKFDGMKSEEAKKEIIEFVGGRTRVQYRIRDWLISRQRYWGPPIPMIYCEKCDWQPVPEEQLPVVLPHIQNFRPTGTGESPLASVREFHETKCPKCGGKARRETDVSDTFLDSAWYYIGYLMKFGNWKLEIGNLPFSRLTRKWLPVDMYTGGAEHAVLHLLYVRFLALALHDMGLLKFGPSPTPKGEPFPRFRAHGLLIKEGAKMSKSKGNVVNPDEYIVKFGADALRMYLMFLAPFEQGGDFRDRGIIGITRFLERVWRLGHEVSGKTENNTKVSLAPAHRAVKKVKGDIEALHYNTAASALMILLNTFEKEGVGVRDFEIFLKLLAPFTPHITEELWQNVLGHKTSIHLERWPEYDPKLIREETFTLVIQVNGKVRDSVEAPSGVSESDAKSLALQREKIRELLKGGKPKKVVYVPGRLINIVV